MSIGTMLFNPFTGAPRLPADIASDPHGALIWDGETPLREARNDRQMCIALMREAAALLESLPIETLEASPLYRWPLCDELGGAASILEDGG